MKTPHGDYYEYETCCHAPVNASAGGYGPAITGSFVLKYIPEWSKKYNEIIGMMIAGNDEYSTQVNFCPFCGKSAEVKIKAP